MDLIFIFVIIKRAFQKLPYYIHSDAPFLQIEPKVSCKMPFDLKLEHLQRIAGNAAFAVCANFSFTFRTCCLSTVGIPLVG